jgi:hypothetical protein
MTKPNLDELEQRAAALARDVALLAQYIRSIEGADVPTRSTQQFKVRKDGKQIDTVEL